MSPDERAQWERRLASPHVPAQTKAVTAILDCVEALESRIAGAIAAQGVILDREKALKSELATARAAPPRPAAIVISHPFDSDPENELAIDSYEVYADIPPGNRPRAYDVIGWTWHPATPAKEHIRPAFYVEPDSNYDLPVKESTPPATRIDDPCPWCGDRDTVRVGVYYRCFYCGNTWTRKENTSG